MPFEFENWAVIALGGIPNRVQVGDMGVDDTIHYIQTQEEHHRKKSFREELEVFLKRHGYDYKAEMLD